MRRRMLTLPILITMVITSCSTREPIVKPTYTSTVTSEVSNTSTPSVIITPAATQCREESTTYSLTGEIIFEKDASDIDINSDIFKLNVRTKELINITSDPSLDLQASVSHNNKSIAFLSNRDDDQVNSIYILTIAGITPDSKRSVSAIYKPNNQWIYFPPSWNYQDTHLAFSEESNDGSSIIVIDIASHRRWKVNSPWKNNYRPIWLPNENSILYFGGNSEEEFATSVELVTLGDIKLGKGSESIYAVDNIYAREEISINGVNTLLFTVKRDHLGINGFLYNKELSYLFSVNENKENHRPKWSPDGNWFVYTQFSNGIKEIVIRNLKSSKEYVIARNTGTNTSYVWSPDSKMLAFTSAIKQGNRFSVSIIITDITQIDQIGEYCNQNKLIIDTWMSTGLELFSWIT